MAKKEEAASDPARPRKLTLSFSGRFAGLYDKIVAQAAADDRDPDLTILRMLDKAFASNDAASA